MRQIFIIKVQGLYFQKILGFTICTFLENGENRQKLQENRVKLVILVVKIVNIGALTGLKFH